MIEQVLECICVEILFEVVEVQLFIDLLEQLECGIVC